MPERSTMPATVGAIPTARQRNGIRAALRCAAVSSICRRRPPAEQPEAFGLDPTFSQFQLVGEIEERHELWGQPGKIKVTGFLSRGRAGIIPRRRSPWPRRPARPPTSRWCATTPAAPASASTWSSRSRRPSACSPAPAGPTARRAVGFHRHRPDAFGRCLDQRQRLGQARRYDRHRRRPQRHCPRASGLFQRRRPGHPDRRWATAESRDRRDCRGLLQLRAHRRDAGFASTISSSSIRATTPTAGRRMFSAGRFHATF